MMYPAIERLERGLLEHSGKLPDHWPVEPIEWQAIRDEMNDICRTTGAMMRNDPRISALGLRNFICRGIPITVAGA